MNFKTLLIRIFLVLLPLSVSAMDCDEFKRLSDVNGDRSIDALDVEELKFILNEIETHKYFREDFIVYDFNQNSTFDLKDLLEINLYIEKKHRCNEPE